MTEGPTKNNPTNILVPLGVSALLFLAYWLLLSFLRPANYTFFDCGAGNGMVVGGCIYERIAQLLAQLSFLSTVAIISSLGVAMAFRSHRRLRYLAPAAYLLLTLQSAIIRFAGLIAR